MIKIYDALHFISMLTFVPACFFPVISSGFKAESVNPFLFRNASGNNMTMMELFLHFLKFSYI